MDGTVFSLPSSVAIEHYATAGIPLAAFTAAAVLLMFYAGDMVRRRSAERDYGRIKLACESSSAISALEHSRIALRIAALPHASARETVILLADHLTLLRAGTNDDATGEEIRRLTRAVRNQTAKIAAAHPPIEQHKRDVA